MLNYIMNDLQFELCDVVQYFDHLNEYDGNDWIMFGGSGTERSLHEVLTCIANFRPGYYTGFGHEEQEDIGDFLKGHVKRWEAGSRDHCMICIQNGCVRCDGNHDATSS